MAEISFPLENTDYGAEEAQLWFSGRTSGVFAANELAVSEGDGMSVTLGKGRAWMAYSEFAGVVYANTVATQIAVPTADAYFDRIDRLIIRFDRTGNTIKAQIISGKPSSTPKAPEIVRNDSMYDLSVAQIHVKTGATEIKAAHITDERLNASVCGLMQDGVTGIDTSVFQAQWDALLRQLSDALNNVQGGSVLTRTSLTLFVPADAWVEQADGSFRQSVNASGILASDAAIIDVDMTDATMDTYGDIADAWATVSRARVQDGAIVLMAYGGAPEISFAIKAEVLR